MPPAPKNDKPLIRLVLIDEKEFMRADLHSVLEQTPGFQIVGEGSRVEEVTCSSSIPVADIVIWGISSEQADFLKEYQAILEQFPKAKVLLLACKADEQTVHTICQATGASCLLKDTPAPALIRMLRLLAVGVNVVEPQLSTLLLAKVQRFSVQDQNGGNLLAI